MLDHAHSARAAEQVVFSSGSTRSDGVLVFKTARAQKGTNAHQEQRLRVCTSQEDHRYIVDVH